MCNDGWDANDAAVVCRQLELPSQCKYNFTGGRKKEDEGQLL